MPGAMSIFKCVNVVVALALPVFMGACASESPSSPQTQQSGHAQSHASLNSDNESSTGSSDGDGAGNIATAQLDTEDFLKALSNSEVADDRSEDEEALNGDGQLVLAKSVPQRILKLHAFAAHNYIRNLPQVDREHFKKNYPVIFEKIRLLAQMQKKFGNAFDFFLGQNGQVFCEPKQDPRLLGDQAQESSLLYQLTHSPKESSMLRKQLESMGISWMIPNRDSLRAGALATRRIFLLLGNEVYSFEWKKCSRARTKR